MTDKSPVLLFHCGHGFFMGDEGHLSILISYAPTWSILLRQGLLPWLLIIDFDWTWESNIGMFVIHLEERRRPVRWNQLPRISGTKGKCFWRRIQPAQFTLWCSYSLRLSLTFVGTTVAGAVLVYTLMLSTQCRWWTEKGQWSVLQ